MKTTSETLVGTTFQLEEYAAAKPGAEDAATLEALYRKMGLIALADRSAPAPSAGQLLTDAELAVWGWRYPSVYSTLNTQGGVRVLRHARVLTYQVTRPWARLTWPVPPHVCGLAQAVREEFDTLEIWTPELRPAPRIGPSPILVGWKHQRVYLLARWAEALEPFEQIAARAKSRRGRRALALRRRWIEQWDPLAAAGWWVQPSRWRMRRVAAWAGWVLDEGGA